MSGSIGCGGSSGQAVAQATGDYDAISVGGGTAGRIVAAKLKSAGRGRKRILIIGEGEPTPDATIGNRLRRGPPKRTDLAIFDVPGELTNRKQAAWVVTARP